MAGAGRGRGRADGLPSRLRRRRFAEHLDERDSVGVDHRGVARRLVTLLPDYMVMGDRGMADMSEMEMPLPDDTLPMMTGQGPFGALEMGGMFTVVKVRDGLARDDYRDPGWYEHPAGTVAYEWKL